MTNTSQLHLHVSDHLYEAAFTEYGELRLLIDASIDIDLDSQLIVSADKRQWQLSGKIFQIPFFDKDPYPDEVSVLLVREGKPVSGAVVPVISEDPP